MKSDFLIAVTQLAAERGLPKESVVSAVEAALISAYKKDTVAAGHNITVRLNPNDGETKTFVLKTVVEAVEDNRKELTLKEAQLHMPNAALGDILELEAEFASAGRIAAQTAKQVVVQRLREAERELVLAEFADQVGDIIAGRIERREPQHVVVSLGRAEAIMPVEEQVQTERYRPNQTLQFFLVEVAASLRGPELILSRAHPNLLRRLFEREVPEIYNGTVEIQGIARESGSRSKVSVSSRQEGVDPVGSCVGLRGFRIQNIVNELQGEKIDVVQWNEDRATYISNALSPAQVIHVEFTQTENEAIVVVPDAQLSLAIGREGQNVRLAAKLTGWKLDIKGASEVEVGVSDDEKDSSPIEQVAELLVEEEEPTPTLTEQEVFESDVTLTPTDSTELESPVATEDSIEDDEISSQDSQEVELSVEVEPVSPPEDLPKLPAVEELLAIEDTVNVDPQEERANEWTDGIEADDDKAWAVPNITNQPTVLRFAEDIMPERARGPSRRGRSNDTNRGKKGRRQTKGPGG